jgi:DNA repair exonuclease SbcCD nuclease subunit
MNLMFCSDFHIIESDLEEINSIFDELLIIKDKYCVNKLIIAGDSFDKISPTSKELDCLASFLKKINLPIVLLAANSHESTTQEQSVINHFGILKDNILVCKEYTDGNKLFVGHFIMNQSSKNFGGTVDSQTLQQYRYVILGHGHNFELSNSNWCQLGSIRYVDFKDDLTIPKKVGICLGYETDRPEWRFIDLNSPIPMISLELSKNDQNQVIANDLPTKNVPKTSSDKANPSSNLTLSDLLTKLDQLPPKTKVRIVFKDYENYRNFLPYYQKYQDKFVKFVEKKDFVISNNLIVAKSENITLKESLINWLEKNKVDEKIKEILLEELK